MNNIIKRLENEMSKFQCVNCRRVTYLNDDDEYECIRGKSPIDISKPKCKYFKRHPLYSTITGLSKMRSNYQRPYETRTRYIRGKFRTFTILMKGYGDETC